MNKPSFDQYYRYDEMTQLLRDFTQAFPQLATLESIGQSYEGQRHLGADDYPDSNRTR